MNTLRRIWDITKSVHAWLMREIAEYPSIAFWTGAVLFVAYALWRR